MRKLFISCATLFVLLGVIPLHAQETTPQPATTVFIIMMENQNWSKIKDSRAAPYINQTLLVQGAHAEAYYNPPRLHPSEPNYLWLEAGTNFGVKDDLDPSANHQASTAHLTTLLD